MTFDILLSMINDHLKMICIMNKLQENHLHGNRDIVNIYNALIEKYKLSTYQTHNNVLMNLKYNVINNNYLNKSRGDIYLWIQNSFDLFLNNKYTNEEKIKFNKIIINFIRNYSILDIICYNKVTIKTYNVENICFNKAATKINFLQNHIFNYQYDIINGYKIYEEDVEYNNIITIKPPLSEKMRENIMIRLLNTGIIIDNLNEELILFLFTYTYDFENDEVLCNNNKLLMKNTKFVELVFNALNNKSKIMIIKIFNAIHDKIFQLLKNGSSRLYIKTFIEYYKIIIGEFNDDLSSFVEPKNNNYLKLF